MKTMVAFKFDTSVSESFIRHSLSRVKHHYYETHKINFEVSEEIYVQGNIGICIWGDKDTPLIWPDKVEDRNRVIMTYAPPPNWKTLCDTDDIKDAPFELFDRLKSNPNLAQDFSSPTTIATIDKHKKEMNIYTDSLGFGRLYEYRGQNCWVWSNKIAALPIFANEKAEIDMKSWKIMSGAGWFMGNTSPIKRVKRVEPSLQIKVTDKQNEPRILINHGGLNKLVSPRGITEVNVPELANNIRESIASFSDLWSIPLKVDLSGGKDSRVSAAAIVASKIDNVEFSTIGILQGEVDTASQLLDVVGYSSKHNIIQRNNNVRIEKKPLVDRVMTLFHEYDGDFAPTFVQSGLSPASYFNTPQKVWIQGAGGEIASGNYYQNDRLYSRLLEQNDNAAFYRLSNYLSSLGAVNEGVKELVDQQLFEILQLGELKGVYGLDSLDYFYLVERFRRWAALNGHLHRYSPFLANQFMRATFDMTPALKRKTSLHNDIINHLVPEWKDISFYKKKPTDRDEKTEKGLRIWQTNEKEPIEDILSTDGIWTDIFNKKEVSEIWSNAIEGNFKSYQETLFHRVVMIGLFEKHIDKINESIT